MDKKSLQKYIEHYIPILKPMKFRIEEMENGMVRVAAPFREHVNHQNTVFGGSIGSLLTLSGWALVKFLLSTDDPDANVVIQSSSVRYLKPVRKDFAAVSQKVQPEELDRFLKTFRRFGRGKITVKSHIVEENGTDKLALFEGSFVALKSGRGSE